MTVTLFQLHLHPRCELFYFFCGFVKCLLSVLVTQHLFTKLKQAINCLGLPGHNGQHDRTAVAVLGTKNK